MKTTLQHDHDHAEAGMCSGFWAARPVLENVTRDGCEITVTDPSRTAVFRFASGDSIGDEPRRWVESGEWCPRTQSWGPLSDGTRRRLAAARRAERDADLARSEAGRSDAIESAIRHVRERVDDMTPEEDAAVSHLLTHTAIDWSRIVESMRDGGDRRARVLRWAAERR